MLRVLIEGWRFLPHSYAIVNQYQCLDLLRRGDIHLRLRDVRPFQPAWRPVRGSLDQASEKLIESITRPGDEEHFDAVYRIAFPYDFRGSRLGQAFVFGTAEYGYVPPHFVVGSERLDRALKNGDTIIVTPSHWSREGFLRSGADPDRIAVIPLGFDPQVFCPTDSCTARRPDSGAFVFLHIGAMTATKNPTMLLKAFARVARRFPNARLLLKGLDGLYKSEVLLRESFKTLTQTEISQIEHRVQYVGEVLPPSAIAKLYHASDAYVSAFSAEAFNLPVLEAAATGLPIICTAGGPPDEFTSDEFTLRIDSRRQSTSVGPFQVVALEPSIDSLCSHMCRLLEDRDFCVRAREAGPRFVNPRFTWRTVVEELTSLFISAKITGYRTPRLPIQWNRDHV